ncbi:MAG: AAA family ATPase [Clostridia bacterium]|nr:AAA family ATPase [Clostridia bacterium]
MKTLYIIGGTMGVGKTSTCQALKKKLNNCVFLDGDWCWDASPFQVTEETKSMVTDNICYLLNSFLRCSAYENVIFCWVMHEQRIIDDIIRNLDVVDCRVKIVSLVCNEESLRKRLQKDIDRGQRSVDIIERSIGRIELYQKLDTVKIDTSDKSIDKVAEEISTL